MGTGWPKVDGTIQVVIGDFWRFANVDFVEDEVITLIRQENQGSNAFFSEDGTSIPNDSTNRLRFHISPNGTQSVWIEGLGDQNGTILGDDAFDFGFAAGGPYDLGEAIAADATFTSYIDTDFFSTTKSTGTTFYYKDRIFKSIIYISG
jgi:hypothetical protein